MELEPLDLVGGELSSGQVQVVSWKVTPPPEAAEKIRAEVRAVTERVGSLNNHVPLAVLANPSFEQPAGEGFIPGWVQARGEGISVTIDSTSAHTGVNSLHMASRRTNVGAAPNVWVRSDPFPPPTTGRISIFTWIRVAAGAKQPRLRLAVEGKLDGQVYYKLAKVGDGEQGPPVKPLTTNWAPYHFLLTDLPATGLTDLRVGFDLMGEGEVWIDDVEVFDLWFDPDKEHRELTQEHVHRGRPSVEWPARRVLAIRRWVLAHVSKTARSYAARSAAGCQFRSHGTCGSGRSDLRRPAARYNAAAIGGAEQELVAFVDSDMAVS